MSKDTQTFIRHARGFQSGIHVFMNVDSRRQTAGMTHFGAYFRDNNMF